MNRAKGIDISHHQLPAALHWPTLAGTYSFAYARATYGTRQDKLFGEHVEAAKGAGIVPGGYHFVRQTQDPAEQLLAFEMALDEAGCGPGWLPPCLDVEANTQFDGEVDPEKMRPVVAHMLAGLLERYGSVVLYVTQREFNRFGDPEWLADPRVLLWVAHWTSKPEPATPMGRRWDFWQHAVGGVTGAQGDIDQNVFRGTRDELPLLRAQVPDTEPPSEPDTLPPGDVPEPTLTDVMAAIQGVDAKVAAMHGAVQTVAGQWLELHREVGQLRDEVADVRGRVEALERGRGHGNGAAC